MNPEPRGTHWPTVFQFIYSAAGMGLYWSLAVLTAVGWLASLTVTDIRTSLLNLSSLGLIGLLFVPPLVYAFQRLLERPARAQLVPALTPLRAMTLLLLWGACLAPGFLAGEQAQGAWTAPLFLVGICLPVILLAWAATAGLRPGSPQRGWGLVSTGMLLSPAIIITIQVALGLAGLVAAVIYFTANPDAARGLNILAQRLAGASQDPELLERILFSYLRQPGVVAALLAYLAVFTPLLEELFKTAGIWLAGFRGAGRTPAGGFAGGALCGAGFALVESLGISGTAGGSWAALTVTRAGTDLLHILSGALMGWALASAFGQRRGWRLPAVYAGVVLLHGLWNALSLATGVLTVLNRSVRNLPLAAGRETLALAGLALLAVGMLAFLLWFNHRLRVEGRLSAEPAGSGLSVPAPDAPGQARIP